MSEPAPRAQVFLTFSDLAERLDLDEQYELDGLIVEQDRRVVRVLLRGGDKLAPETVEPWMMRSLDSKRMAIIQKLADSDPIVNTDWREDDCYVCVFCDAGCGADGERDYEMSRDEEKVSLDHREDCVWIMANRVVGR